MIFWRRVFAYVIDMIILSFVVVSPFKKYLAVETIKDINLNVFLVGLVAALLVVFYFALFEFYFSQTIGKLILGIRVKSKIFKIKLKRLEFKQCFVRNISKVSTILYILDLLYLLRNKKQRYLEVKSKTVTVRI